jgi:hypothetical protein
MGIDIYAEWTGMTQAERAEQFSCCGVATLPILAAFRNLVRINPKTKKAEWVNGFAFVLSFWEMVRAEAITVTHQAIQAFGRSPNEIGRARPHWSLLHLTLDRRLAHALEAQGTSKR